jgi:AcrR family transcriptional regulator
MASARPRVSQVERRARTRQRLLDAARVVFGERGFGAATLEEVARVAGLTRGALYYNFSGSPGIDVVRVRARLWS